MSELSGSELVGFIKERQAGQVRSIQARIGRAPKLAIIHTGNDPLISIYMGLKEKYATDIGIEVDIVKVSEESACEAIKKLNTDKTVDGIIVQLPLSNSETTDKIVNCVDVAKDVDGLAKNSNYDPSTPTAIIWLLNGYNIDLQGKNILVVGQGRLVGAPLSNMLLESKLNVTSADINTQNLTELVADADIIISAVGKPGLIKSDYVKTGSVVVDAGTSVENGVQVGDTEEDLRKRDDIKITPKKGGVGPLTIAALFDNLIRAV